MCSKLYRLIPSALLKKFTHYSFSILILLPIIPILFFLFYCFSVLTSRETCMDLMHNFVVAIV